MSVATSRAQMYDSLKVLREQWHKVLNSWNDPVTKQFEEEYLQELESASVAALNAIDRLGQMLQQIRTECGEESETIC